LHIPLFKLSCHNINDTHIIQPSLFKLSCHNKNDTDIIQPSLFKLSCRNINYIHVIQPSLFKLSCRNINDTHIVILRQESLNRDGCIICMYMLSGCELIDTENISLPSQNMKFVGE
jgi:hypothetical protein